MVSEPPAQRDTPRPGGALHPHPPAWGPPLRCGLGRQKGRWDARTPQGNFCTPPPRPPCAGPHLASGGLPCWVRPERDTRPGGAERGAPHPSTTDCGGRCGVPGACCLRESDGSPVPRARYQPHARAGGPGRRARPAPCHAAARVDNHSSSPAALRSHEATVAPAPGNPRPRLWRKRGLDIWRALMKLTYYKWRVHGRATSKGLTTKQRAVPF